MNKTLGWMLAAVLSLSLISSANAQSSPQRTGKVVRIKGEARYSTGNKVWQPLKVGTVLKSGYVVQTAMNSFVDVVLSETDKAAAANLTPLVMAVSSPAAGSGAGGGAGVVPTPDQDVIRVLDDSYLVFDSLTATATGADTVTETMLDLKKGSVFGSVKKQAAASRFEVKTPNGVAGIRGTIFLISANGNIACLVGSIIVAFTDAAGNVVTQVVGAGQMFDAATRQVSAIGGPLLSRLTNLAQECNYGPGAPGFGRPGRGGFGRDLGFDKISRHSPYTITVPLYQNNN